jgi:signal transduction histidine kinase
MKPVRVLLIQQDRERAGWVCSFCLKSAPHLLFTVVTSRAECWSVLASSDESPFDALVIDDGLDNGESSRLLREVIEASYPAPVVIVTAQTDVETAVAAMKEGATDYLVKSGDYWEHLPRVVEGAIARYQLVRENQRLLGRLTNYATQLEELVQQTQFEKARLQAVLEQLPEGVLVVEGPDGQIAVANKAAERLWGHTAAPPGTSVIQEPAQHQVEYLDGTPMPTEDMPVARVLRRGQPVLGQQIVLVQPSGTRITVLVNAAPLRDNAGMVRGGVVVFQDISELKRLEQLKDEILSIASHELKNPLTIIRGYSSLLARSVAVQQDARMQRMTDTIRQQVERMQQLVGRLLDLSRLDLGTMALYLSPIDLAQLVRDIVEQQQMTTPHHRLRCVLEEESLVLDGDYMRLEQVLINLVSNAIKYSPAGGDVELVVGGRDEVAMAGGGVGLAYLGAGPFCCGTGARQRYRHCPGLAAEVV